MYSLINLFSGGALLKVTVFAVGVMPYITASIIVQLLTVVIPRFEELRKEGQAGQAKMTQYTRYLAIALAILQATSIVALAASGQLLQGCQQDIITDQSIFSLVVIVLVVTAGAALVMWMGELITERGIGNGMSLLIFVGIAARIYPEGKQIFDSRAASSSPPCVGPRCSSSWAWCSSNRVSAASRCSTPSAWWAGACTAARRPICRSKSTRPALSRSSSRPR